MDPAAHIVRDLQRPAAYPFPVERVGLRQTHVSWLFFAGDHVYKVKKPVDLGFLDFTDLAQRRHFCEEEVRLNRRLAPHVYLGLVPITRSPTGRLRFGSVGETVDWAVEMVRLPERRMLSNLLDRGEIDNTEMNEAVALLARFHAESATGPGVDEYGSPEAIAANVEQNFEQLRPFVATGKTGAAGLSVLSPRQHAFLCARARGFLDDRRELLERRVREHRIREGHGDLHAENLCFTDAGLVAYDCLEFSRALRCGDVASDLAFLAMDLDFRGYPGFSGYLAKRYAKVTGDAELPALLPFYKGYRAVVRGKVAALTAVDPEVDWARREELRCRAMRYLQLAAAYELPPSMILMCGLPGCGKSWLAKRLAGALRAAVLHSDVRRKLLAGVAPTTRVHEGYETGLYAPEVKERTYRSLLRGALDNLRAGHSVIVDATFSRKHYRSAFVDAAARLELPYYVLHVTADDAVIRERLARRRNETREVSDADLDVYLRERIAFEPPEEVPHRHLVASVSGAGIPEAQSSIVIDRMIELREGR